MTFFIIALVVLAAIVVTGYLQPGWSWTGLRDDSKKPKTLWDWLGLLIIPLVIAAGGYAINEAQASREKKKAAADEKQAKELAADVRNAESLRAYLQQMSGLIATNKLATSDDPSLRGLATSLTLTVLRQLDRTRKGQVVQFLVDAELLAGEDGVIDTYGANLRKANLRGAYLQGAYFNQADFDGADFHGAILDETDFADSNLRGANFSEAGYIDDETDPASFDGTCLTEARFTNAVLSGASLVGAEGRDVNFSGADFDNADFTKAQLANVSARNATYAGATLPKGWKQLRAIPLSKRATARLCENTITAVP